jgi:hypothetical protein
MATANHLGDSAKSEFSTKKQNVVMASTDAWAFSQADYDTGAETGPKGYADAWGGYAVSVQATDDAPGTTVRSTVKPVDLSASASTTKTVSASVRMKGGDGLASLETQKLLTAAAAHATFTVSSPLSTGKYRTVNTGTETETGSDPNYAVAYLSLATSSWNIHPIPV